MKLSFTPLETLTGIVVILLSIPIIIAVCRWWLARYADHRTSKKTEWKEIYFGRKKHPWVDVLRDTTTARLIGMTFSMGIVVLLMNFTQYEKTVELEVYKLVVDEEIEIEPPRTAEPPPPPPPPPPPLIAEVPNEEILEEDQPVFEDQTVDEETVFEEVEYTPPPPETESAAPPPPPPPPPPPESDVTEIFKVVEQMPMFGGCKDKACSDRKLLSYMQSNLVYPAIARENDIVGRVFIQFVVERDGSVTDAKILRDIGGGCGKAALKVVQDMNNLALGWTAGQQRGKPVRVLYTLPATFMLQ